jgi:hypothetical protein
MNMRIRVKLAYAFIGATYIAVILSILLGCRPMSKNWQIYPDPGNYCQPAVSHIDVYVTVVLNVATDLYLITIPTPVRLAQIYPNTIANDDRCCSKPGSPGGKNASSSFSSAAESSSWRLAFSAAC